MAGDVRDRKQGAGQAFGPVLAGSLLATGRFDLAFVAAGAIGLAAPVIVAGWTDTPIPSAAHAAQFVLNGALNAFLPLHARDVIGLTTTQIGWLFAAQTVTMLATRPLLGAVSDRLGRRAVIIAGLSLCSVTVGMIPLVDEGWFLAGCLVTYAAGVTTTSAATSAFVTDVTRRARYGAAHGVFGTIYDIGDASGPIVAGLHVAAVGYVSMFKVMAVIGPAAAVVFALSSRTDRPTV